MIKSHIILLDSHTVRLCYNADIMYNDLKKSEKYFSQKFKKAWLFMHQMAFLCHFMKLEGTRHKWRTEVHFLLIVRSTCILSVSEQLLLSATWANFHLYHGENKLRYIRWDDDDVPFVL